jgi:hypothetical protein
MMRFIQNIKMTPPQYFGEKFTNFTLCALLFSMAILALPACKTKSGCPTSGFTNTMEKNTRGGNSQLFPKKMRKKMKKS